MAETRKRVAAIVTEYRPRSHADVLVTRLLEGYQLFWTPVQPAIDVVSLYTDQVPANDISRAVAARHDLPIYPTIREALTRGGNELAVDGVLLVGEHGDYPLNEKGQKAYPRRRFFEETVAVFRASGRVVPTFNDKHLAFDWPSARWMYDTGREMGIPFMAGSSIPITYRCPPVQVRLGAEVEEVVAVAHGPLESYGFHALEMVQCLAERRRGYETGVVAVQTLSGGAFWEAWERGDRWSPVLAAAALAAVPHAEGAPRAFYDRRRREHGPADAFGPDGTPLRPLHGAEHAFCVEYADGLRATVLMLAGYAQQWGAAVRVRGEADPLATCFLQGRDQLNWNFAHLSLLLERFVQTGRAPYPVERTLLATGVLDAAMTSRYHSGQRQETPQLAAIRYRPAELA